MKIGTQRFITLQLSFEEAEALTKSIKYGRGNIDVNSRAYEIVDTIEDGLDETLSDWEENR